MAKVVRLVKMLIIGGLVLLLGYLLYDFVFNFKETGMFFVVLLIVGWFGDHIWPRHHRSN